jgi:hypothetical protein
MKSVNLVEFHCHETICKGEFSSTSQRSLNEMLTEAYEYPEMYGGGHSFSQDNGDGTFEMSMYLTKAEDDMKIENAIFAQIYEEMTGKSTDTIVPTDEQIETAVAKEKELAEAMDRR